MLTVSKKLSKQQKAILEFLYKRVKGHCYKQYLSWHIAEKFNKDHKDRIDDYTKASLEIMQEANEQDTLSDSKFKLLYLKSIFLKSRRKKKRLTPKHRASLSRSIKRLEQRGLVERRNVGVFLTEEGREVCQQLFE